MKCAEIMTKEPKMCVPDDEVAVAINLMWDHDCGDIVVVEDMESKQLISIVTDRDIAMSVVRCNYSHPFHVRVRDCMAPYVIACQPEVTIETAIELMSIHKIRRIPIVDENSCCIGIISQADLLLHASDIKPVVDMLQQISAPRNISESDESRILMESDQGEETFTDSNHEELELVESATKEVLQNKSTKKKKQVVMSEA